MVISEEVVKVSSTQKNVIKFHISNKRHSGLQFEFRDVWLLERLNKQTEISVNLRLRIAGVERTASS